jgi:hypothetical protein
MKNRIDRTDFLTGVILFLFAAWYGVQAWRLPRVHLQDVIDSHVYPMVLSFVLGLLSVGLMLKGLWKGEKQRGSWLPSKKALGQIFFLFLALIAYILLFQNLGYISSSIIFMVGILKFLDRQRSLLAILILSLLISGVCYTLFVYLFNIQVPPGILI